MRHASARCLSAASTVQVHVFISRKLLYFGAEIVGLNSNRAGYADSGSTVVTKATPLVRAVLLFLDPEIEAQTLDFEMDT
jgi:hypothetical protein